MHAEYQTRTMKHRENAAFKYTQSKQEVLHAFKNGS